MYELFNNITLCVQWSSNTEIKKKNTYNSQPLITTKRQTREKSGKNCELTLIYFRRISVFIFIYFFLSFVFLGPHLRHMEVPRIGVESELQLLVFATVTATWYLSHVCNLHHSSWQPRILNPLSKTRDQTRVLMDPSQIPYCWATMGTPKKKIFFKSNLICIEPLATRWETQCPEPFYSHPRGLKRPRTSERDPVVFGPLQSLHAGSRTEPPSVAVSTSCTAWAQGHHAACPSRFIYL